MEQIVGSAPVLRFGVGQPVLDCRQALTVFPQGVRLPPRSYCDTAIDPICSGRRKWDTRVRLPVFANGSALKTGGRDCVH